MRIMQDEWRPIAGFPDYEIDPHGNIVKASSGRPLRVTSNGYGHHKVNLRLNGKTYTRALEQLVAKTYLPPPARRDFISVIHLDGNLENYFVENLMWRPRYFTVRYHRQFALPIFRRRTPALLEVKTGDIYERAQVAVTTHGLLLNELLLAVSQRTYVWPTYQEFREI